MKKLFITIALLLITSQAFAASPPANYQNFSANEWQMLRLWVLPNCTVVMGQENIQNVFGGITARNSQASAAPLSWVLPVAWQTPDSYCDAGEEFNTYEACVAVSGHWIAGTYQGTWTTGSFSFTTPTMVTTTRFKKLGIYGEQISGYLKIHVADASGTLISDTYLPGNAAGFTANGYLSEDLSSVPNNTIELIGDGYYDGTEVIYYPSILHSFEVEAWGSTGLTGLTKSGSPIIGLTKNGSPIAGLTI